MVSVRVLLGLAFCVLAQARNFFIENRSGQTLWIGILGNGGKPALEDGGFQLNNGQQRTVGAPEDWAGRFWARTGCGFDGNGRGHCETGDCGDKLQCRGAGGVPPASLAEITLNGAGGQDFYDVSLVDGFNVPVQMLPTGGGASGAYRCQNANCRAQLNGGCPDQLRLRNGRGDTVGCKSACLAFNSDRDCCRGPFGTPDRCPPPDLSRYFKSNCPAAYSYAYDDKTSTFTCANTDYRVIFG